jgi:vitamin B12 transporter
MQNRIPHAIPRMTVAVAVAINAIPTLAETIEETVIVADRVDTSNQSLAVSVNVIDRALMEALGSATLPQLLKTQVGISTTQTGGLGAVSGIRVRGQDGFRTKVLLDGVDISDPSSPQIGPRMEHVLSGSLDRIEVLRGTQGLLWGADAGGVISLTSHSGSAEASLDIELERGGYGFESETLTAASGGTSMGEATLLITKVALDGFNARLDDTVLADRDGYDNDSFHVSYTSPEWQGWSATLIAREVDAKTDYDLCYTAAFSTSNDCTDDYKNDSQAVVIYHSDDTSQTRISLSESTSERAYATDGAVGFSTEGHNDQLTAMHSRQINETYRVTIGVDLDEQGYDDGFDQRSRDNNAAYANLQRKSDNFIVSGGIRVDDNDDFGRHTSWRLTALTPTAFEGVAAKVAVGTGFRAPSPYEIGYNTGPWAFSPATDAPLKEEQSNGWEIGLRDVTGAVTWDLTFFNQKITDAIIFDLVNYSGYVQIAGESESTGIEASMDWQLTERFSVGGFVSQLDAEDSLGMQLPYRPELTMQLNARYNDGDSSWMLLARHTADRVDEFGSALSDYTLMDATFARKVTDSIDLSLRAENLANQAYTDIAGYRSPRRALYIGIKVAI